MIGALVRRKSSLQYRLSNPLPTGPFTRFDRRLLGTEPGPGTDQIRLFGAVCVKAGADVGRGFAPPMAFHLLERCGR